MRTVVLVPLLVGCLPGPSGPRPGARPTGEQLAIVDDVKQWTTAYREKTGETDVKNANGDTIYTEEHFADRTQLHEKQIWYGVQGRSQLNDEDLFSMTGDRDSLTATRDMRSRGRTYAALGTTGMLVGIGAMIAAKVFATDTLQIGLYCGGLAIGGVGAYGFVRGWEMQSPDNHAVERSIAEDDAKRYNRQVGRGASLTLFDGHF